MPFEYIALEASAGSIVLAIQIVVPASAAAFVPIEAVAASMASANASVMANTLGAIVTQLTGPVVSNRTYTVEIVSRQVVQISCYPGHWCTGGQGETTAFSSLLREQCLIAALFLSLRSYPMRGEHIQPESGRQSGQRVPAVSSARDDRIHCLDLSVAVHMLAELCANRSSSRLRTQHHCTVRL
mgnify:CR=1 FL=1